MFVKKLRLLHLVEGAQKNSVTAGRFRVSREEAARIRRAEEQGGHDAGLRVVLQLLRDRQQRDNAS